MTTEESQNNDIGEIYIGWWWCQLRYGKTEVEVKYNYDGLLKQHRSHGMIVAGVDAKSNCNVSSYVRRKKFRMVRSEVAEAQGNWDGGRKY